jgi:hypothetical protein
MIEVTGRGPPAMKTTTLVDGAVSSSLGRATGGFWDGFGE